MRSFHRLCQSIERGISSLLCLALFLQLFLLLFTAMLIRFCFFLTEFESVSKLLIDGVCHALLEFILCLCD